MGLKRLRVLMQETAQWVDLSALRDIMGLQRDLCSCFLGVDVVAAPIFHKLC